MLHFQTFQKISTFVNTTKDIERIVDRGAWCHVAIKNTSNIDTVYKQLNQWKGMDVYKKADIPDFLHFKNHKDILDIMVITKGEVMIGEENDEAIGDLYLPTNFGDDSQAAQAKGGSHGFNDVSNGYETQGNFSDVRTVFMAVGPDFKANHTHQWIKLVDEYQVILLSKVSSKVFDFVCWGLWPKFAEIFNQNLTVYTYALHPHVISTGDCWGL
jgi:hypothetical protein